MSWRPAKSITVLLAEVNTAWPNRDKASDGIKGDAAHAARVSDHNPDANGVVHAIDFDKDGIPADRIVERLRRMGEYGDPRLKYVIWQRRIYSAKTGWKGEHYDGTNAHDHHFHVSVTEAHGDDTGPWHIADQPPGDEFMAALTDQEQHDLAQRVTNIEAAVGPIQSALYELLHGNNAATSTDAKAIADELAKRLKD